MEHNLIAMEKREASQANNTESGYLKESIYSELPEKRLNNFTSFDVGAGDKLYTANVASIDRS